MKNAIIVHGKPSKENYYSVEHPSSSNFAWIPWLQKQLIVQDIKTDTPEMPHAYLPDYALWKREFERFDITPETTLVGHSMGGGFLVRWLSEHSEIKTGKVILVAPSLDPLKQNETGFCDFTIDPELTNRVDALIVMTSDNDSDKAVMSVKMLTDALPSIDVRLYPGFGHFIPEHMGRETFSELVEIILE
jgi:predicted alpha/beta hydrolase family esterase